MTLRHIVDHAQTTTLDEFTSADPPMQACLEQARLAAQIDLPVLILGESGTGKTILARAIHNSSPRARGPYVSFNAAALSETLLDSQLFGHERGAFTGAQQRVKGKFEMADGGTLFLDEIADMSPQGQSKILRAIEYGEFERLGSETLQRADVRVLSATHQAMNGLMKSDRFRHDLFYRISGVTVVVPPLRCRPSDLPVLIAGEIARASRQQGRAIVGLNRGTAEQMLAYAWPGNLRELSKVVHAAVALTKGEIIEEAALLLQPCVDPVDASDVSSRPVRRPAGSLALRDAIHDHIRFVLEQVRGNKRRAARELRVARATLERKLKEMGGAGLTGKR